MFDLRLLILPNSKHITNITQFDNTKRGRPGVNTSFSMVPDLLLHNWHAPSTLKNTLVTVLLIVSYLFLLSCCSSFSTWIPRKRLHLQPPELAIARNWSGLEPGFEPQRVYSSLEEAHNLSGVKQPALPPPRPPRGATAASRAGEDIVAGRKRSLVW